MKYILHPDADEEFAAAIRYYSEISPELGQRFYREMERLFLEICVDPKRYRKFDPTARRHFSHDFPYAVIWIFAIMNMSRRPGFWRERLGA